MYTSCEGGNRYTIYIQYLHVCMSLYICVSLHISESSKKQKSRKKEGWKIVFDALLRSDLRLLCVHWPWFVVRLDGEGRHGNGSSSRHNTSVSLSSCRRTNESLAFLHSRCRASLDAAHAASWRGRWLQSRQSPAHVQQLLLLLLLFITSCSLSHPRLLSTQHPRCPPPAPTQHFVSMDIRPSIQNRGFTSFSCLLRRDEPSRDQGITRARSLLVQICCFL